MLGAALRLVIHPTTNQTYPSFRVHHSLKGLHIEFNYSIQPLVALVSIEPTPGLVHGHFSFFSPTS